MLFFSRDDFFYDETNTKFSKEGCLDPEVATFGVFNTVMTTADNVTDYIQAAEYWNSDNFWWAGLTLGKDYYIDGWNTRFCQCQLGEAFEPK